MLYCLKGCLENYGVSRVSRLQFEAKPLDLVQANGLLIPSKWGRDGAFEGDRAGQRLCDVGVG
jgi:hypothetical protein